MDEKAKFEMMMHQFLMEEAPTNSGAKDDKLRSADEAPHKKPDQ